MKQYIGQLVKLHIKVDSKDLFFTARITEESSETHTCFIDKYGKKYTFHDELIKQTVVL